MPGYDPFEGVAEVNRIIARVDAHAASVTRHADSIFEDARRRADSINAEVARQIADLRAQGDATLRESERILDEARERARTTGVPVVTATQRQHSPEVGSITQALLSSIHEHATAQAERGPQGPQGPQGVPLRPGWFARLRAWWNSVPSGGLDNSDFFEQLREQHRADRLTADSHIREVEQSLQDAQDALQMAKEERDAARKVKEAQNVRDEEEI